MSTASSSAIIYMCTRGARYSHVDRVLLEQQMSDQMDSNRTVYQRATHGRYEARFIKKSPGTPAD